MLWFKAFHIIFMVAWFSGLFYLPRLFVYHATTKDSISNERFKVMERKLYYAITTPSGVLAMVFGYLVMSYNLKAYMHMPWMQLKLIFVLGVWIYHILCGRYLNAFKKDCNVHSHQFYRWFNEVPTLLLTIIVILVVIKP